MCGAAVIKYLQTSKGKAGNCRLLILWYLLYVFPKATQADNWTLTFIFSFEYVPKAFNIRDNGSCPRYFCVSNISWEKGLLEKDLNFYYYGPHPQRTQISRPGFLEQKEMLADKNVSWPFESLIVISNGNWNQTSLGSSTHSMELANSKLLVPSLMSLVG